MKISEVVVTAYSKPFEQSVDRPDRRIRQRDILVVTIATDDGCSGLGFLTGLHLASGSELSILHIIAERALRPALLGQDPRDIERLWHSMYQSTARFGRRGAVIRAMSAIDIALWDLKARWAEMPLYKLLGGFAESVPAYASGGYTHELEPLLVEIRGYVDNGFDAVKMHIGGGSLDEDLERVAAVREVLGPHRKLMVDATGHLSVREAAAIARHLEPFDIFWFEEPLNLDDVSGYARLAGMVHVSIAAGGGEYLRQGFHPHLQAGAIDVVQADATRTGGITEWLKIAGLAATYNVPMAPHAVQEIHQHLVPAVPNGLMLEFFDHEHEIQRFISEAFGSPVNPVAGTVTPSQCPGLGLELIQEAVEPWRVRLADGM